MYTTNSTQTIFPHKLVGKIEENYLADFLILNQNPLDAIDAINDLFHMYKSGGLLLKK